MSFNLARARLWAAVEGIEFPGPVQKMLDDIHSITVRPPVAEWIEAAELARHFGISTNRANQIGVREDKDYKVYVDPLQPNYRRKYFHRSKVLNACVLQTLNSEDYSGTHKSLKEAMQYLGVGRTSIAKYVSGKRLHPIRVSDPGKKGLYYMYPIEELDRIKEERKKRK